MERAIKGFVAILVAAGLAGAVGIAATEAQADDFVLAVSKAHKLQVIAEGARAWCGPNLRLRMVLEKDSPDLGDVAAQVDMMNRLKTPITTDCKLATAADLVVVEPGREPTAYAATAAGGWAFAAALAKPSEAATGPAAAAPPKPAVVQGAGVPQVAAATPAVATDGRLPPPRFDYYAGLLRMVKDDPTLADEEGVVRLWAHHRFRDDYNRWQNQEFKLRTLLQKARADLTGEAALVDRGEVMVVFESRLGTYDFGNDRFPVSLGTVAASFHAPCCGYKGAPSDVVVKLPELAAISALPMAPEAAQAFTERRTLHGSVDRRVYVAVTALIDEAGFKRDGDRAAVALGQVRAAAFFGDEKLKDRLLQMAPAAFAEWRQARADEATAAAGAEAERAAEATRRQAEAKVEADRAAAQPQQAAPQPQKAPNAILPRVAAAPRGKPWEGGGPWGLVLIGAVALAGGYWFLRRRRMPVAGQPAVVEATIAETVSTVGTASLSSIHVTIEQKSRPGLIAGVLGCAFAFIGLFLLAVVFVPLALICAVVALYQGIRYRAPFGIVLGALAIVLAVVDFMISPTLWLLFGLTALSF